MDVECVAPAAVRDAIAAAGRTEDVCFSPSNTRIAIACFTRNRILLIDCAIEVAAGRPLVTATGSVECSSPALTLPHGLDFLDDHTLVVTNRAGDLVVFSIPGRQAGVALVELTPIQVWSPGGGVLNAPGSVTVERSNGAVRDVLVCNNDGNTVSRHRLDLAANAAASRQEVVIRKWLDTPDGVTVSADGGWIAVSNHNTHSVFVYRNDEALTPDADPAAILRRVHYPHGLRFSADGRYLFVADAGAPYVHVYARGDGWSGAVNPLASLRILDDARYRLGRHNPMEGGPKGLAIDRTGTVLALTSEYQPLEFFSVEAMRTEAEQPRDESAMAYAFELVMMEEDRRVRTRNQELKASVEYMLNSQSWKLTAPLRRLHEALSSR